MQNQTYAYIWLNPSILRASCFSRWVVTHSFVSRFRLTWPPSCFQHIPWSPMSVDLGALTLRLEYVSWHSLNPYLTLICNRWRFSFPLHKTFLGGSSIFSTAFVLEATDNKVRSLTMSDIGSCWWLFATSRTCVLFSSVQSFTEQHLWQHLRRKTGRVMDKGFEIVSAVLTATSDRLNYHAAWNEIYIPDK